MYPLDGEKKTSRLGGGVKKYRKVKEEVSIEQCDSRGDKVEKSYWEAACAAKRGGKDVQRAEYEAEERRRSSTRLM